MNMPSFLDLNESESHISHVVHTALHTVELNLAMSWLWLTCPLKQPPRLTFTLQYTHRSALAAPDSGLWSMARAAKCQHFGLLVYRSVYLSACLSLPFIPSHVVPPYQAPCPLPGAVLPCSELTLAGPSLSDDL